MRLSRSLFLVLAAVGILAVHAEITGTLAPVSQENVLELLPTGLRAAEHRVLDAAVADDNTYFLVGLPYPRSGSAGVLLRVGSDGSHDAKLLPPGEVRSLGVDAELNVQVLMLPERRGADPKMVTCFASLISCSVAPFADENRHVWTRLSRGDHAVELSFDGALFVDGRKLLAAPRAFPAIEPTRLLSMPGDARAVYLNQASGALAVLDPARPSSLQSTNIRGKEFEAVKEQDHTTRAGMPVEGRSGGLAIYAATLSPDGRLFLALSPYNEFDGALVIEASLSGATQRAVRCALPKNQSGERAIHPVHIGVRGNHLILVSGFGDVLTYTL